MNIIYSLLFSLVIVSAYAMMAELSETNAVSVDTKHLIVNSVIEMGDFVCSCHLLYPDKQESRVEVPLCRIDLNGQDVYVIPLIKALSNADITPDSGWPNKVLAFKKKALGKNIGFR
ncbi:hypothetical protein CI610_00536 [invertebrate metagenome]|uniref:Uncharacterized protein n=1 Tax=invertebrate metagenome TaxID=1711999 RepID=A0A2H9TB79_9ZZZZ